MQPIPPSFVSVAITKECPIPHEAVLGGLTRLKHLARFFDAFEDFGVAHRKSPRLIKRSEITVFDQLLDVFANSDLRKWRDCPRGSVRQKPSSPNSPSVAGC